MSRPSLPDKLFFRIGEVAEIVGVRSHVLRYWEEELGVLRPMKTRGSHRQYRRRDVEIALVVKKLLHEDGFTLAGVRRKLREMGLADAIRMGERTLSHELSVRAELLAIREELSGLLASLDPAKTSVVAAPSVAVTAREDEAEHARVVSRAPAKPREV